MYKQLAATAVLIVALLITAASPSASAEELKTLRKGDITVTYPAGLEDKAVELADFAAKNTLPIRDRFVRIRKALSDTDKISKRIVEWLGCPEEQKEAKKALSELADLTDAAETLYTDIKLYREPDVKASGGIREGSVTLSYDPSDGSFYSNWLASSDQSKDARQAFLPVAVGENGLYNGKPVDDLAEGLDATALGALVSTHEAAEAVLLNRLRFYHPYARWFNDGVSNWVLQRLAEEFLADERETWIEDTLPGKGHESLRPRINLLSWTQVDYSPRNPTEEEASLDQANYMYATEAIDRMFRDLPRDSLEKVIRKLKGKRCPDTDTICAAIKEVTGRDAKGMLLEYVPNSIRTDLAQKVDLSLYDQAKRLVSDMDYAGIVRLLSRSVEIQPNSMDAHFNLAWAMRKAGEPKDRSEQQIKIVWALAACKGGYSLDPFEQDEEAIYLLGRVFQLSRLAGEARDTLKKVLESDPNHADARAALAELDKEQSKDRK